MQESAYWKEIESYFAKKRGRAMILSPKDWPLVSSWQERGLPLEVIFQGIDRAFERFEEKQQLSQSRIIRTLAACQNDVEEIWNARQGITPTPSQQAEKDAQQHLAAECRKLSTKLRSTTEQLRKYANTPLYQNIQADLVAAAGTLETLIPLVEQADTQSTLGDIRQQIHGVEQRLISGLEHALDDDTRQQLYAKAEAKLASHRSKMTKQAYQETLRITFLHALRDAYPLPSLL